MGPSTRFTTLVLQARTCTHAYTRGFRVGPSTPLTTLVLQARYQLPYIHVYTHAYTHAYTQVHYQLPYGGVTATDLHTRGYRDTSGVKVTLQV